MTSQLWLAAPLAALWWAHAPIALWFTGIAALSQLIRLWEIRRKLAPFMRAAAGVVVFIILAQYPFVSVAAIETPGSNSTIVGSLAHPEKPMEFVRSVFPSILKPLSDHARLLSDLQLGYAYWALLMFSFGMFAFSRRHDIAALLAGSCLLLLLLVPIPGLTGALWNLVPASVVRITYYWPMQRFYIIIAALLGASAQLSFGSRKSWPGTTRVAFTAVLSLGCAWSVWESRQFMRAASERTASAESSALVLHPENIVLMDHAYGLFPRMPSYFSNGVMDPGQEVRLLPMVSGIQPAAPGGSIVQFGPLKGTVDANPGILDLEPRLNLIFGHRYSLEIDFAHGDATGILQLQGRTMFREYALPSSGESKAFGSRQGNNHAIQVWTTDVSGDDVQLRFIPMVTGVATADFMSFGSFRLRDIESSGTPVAVESLVPLRLRTNCPSDIVIETPRVFMPGYIALVDGEVANVLRSNEGLASVAVPAGRHDVRLVFRAPLRLSLSYWFALIAWALVMLLAGSAALRPRSLCALARRLAAVWSHVCEWSQCIRRQFQ